MMRWLIIKVAFAAGLTLGTVRVPAADWFVTPEGAGLADGSDWDNAFSNLFDAVAAAADSDTVYLGAGSYTVTNELLLDQGVRLHGVAGAPNTVIRRTGGANHRVLRMDHEGAAIEQVMITGGYAASGAGVYMTAGRIENSIVSNNASYSGAGIYMSGGTVRDSEIVNNPGYHGGSGNGQGGGSRYRRVRISTAAARHHLAGQVR